MAIDDHSNWLPNRSKSCIRTLKHDVSSKKSDDFFFPHLSSPYFFLPGTRLWQAATGVLFSLLIFRINRAMARFWEGTGLLHQMRCLASKAAVSKGSRVGGGKAKISTNKNDKIKNEKEKRSSRLMITSDNSQS